MRGYREDATRVRSRRRGRVGGSILACACDGVLQFPDFIRSYASTAEADPVKALHNPAAGFTKGRRKIFWSDAFQMLEGATPSRTGCSPAGPEALQSLNQLLEFHRCPRKQAIILSPLQGASQGGFSQRV